MGDDLILKLLNLNVGIKIDNNKEVIKLLNNDEYDIITLQESMRKIDNSVFDKYNNSNIIKSQINLKNTFFGPLWVADHHEKNNKITKDFGGLAEQGNEIFTKYPIIKASNIFYYKEYSIFVDTTNFRQEDHPRAFIDMIINVNGKELQIINVHGIWNKDKVGDKRTISQSEIILAHIRKHIPCIVVGDFNLLPNTESIDILNKNMINLIDKYGIKSTRPVFDDGLDKGNLVCDYIFVNDKIKVNDFQVLNNNASDHLPLLLDFEI